jgi:HPt (histidine-containing phosphotransfer) domain-containing protein
MSDVFDETALMERVDDDIEFLAETIAMLDEDSPPLLEEIQAAVAARDATALVTPAHALKGMLANFCAPSAEAAARELEFMGREDRLTDAEAAADRVQQETDRLREALHEFLRTRSG